MFLFYILGLATAPLVLPLLKPALRGAVKGGYAVSNEVKKTVDQARQELNEIKEEQAAKASATPSA